MCVPVSGTGIQQILYLERSRWLKNDINFITVIIFMIIEEIGFGRSSCCCFYTYMIPIPDRIVYSVRKIFPKSYSTTSFRNFDNRFLSLNISKLLVSTLFFILLTCLPYSCSNNNKGTRVVQHSHQKSR